MGKLDVKELKPFTQKEVADKSLVISMLKYEDSLIHGDEGKKIYSDMYYKPRISLDPEYALNRLTLGHFGFDTDDTSVANYRSIFKHYYHSPTKYDKDVLGSVTYMRENKCVYYDTPVLNVGDQLPDCKIFTLDGKTETSLSDIIGKDFNYAFVGAFSGS